MFRNTFIFPCLGLMNQHHIMNYILPLVQPVAQCRYTIQIAYGLF